MKTNLLTTTLLLISIALFAQDEKNKIFYLDSLHKVTNEENYEYTRVVENYNTKKNLYAVSEYYKSGKTRMITTSKNKNNLQLEGLRIDYYENGNKKQESNYVNNKLHGKQLEWYDNGEMKSEKEITWDAENKNSIIKILQFWNKHKQQTVIDGNGQYEDSDKNIYEKGSIKSGKKEGVWEGKDLKENYTFSEIYRDGQLISGTSTDKENNKYNYKVLNEKATHKKGMFDFYSFIGKNYRRPAVQGLEGKIYITFIVNIDGSLSDFKILKDIGHGTGEEGIRVLKKAENWIPGKARGITTKTSYSLPIKISAGNKTYKN